MPATGVSGLDLYVKTAAGKWQWVANGRPTAETNTAQLASGLPAGEKEYMLYLPLYNGVSSVEIGLPKGTSLKKADARPAGKDKPIVFYGTSITQGGCASRPGMVHTAIIGRKLDRPVINLGFSGNGTLDPDIADLLGELDASVFVLDWSAKSGALSASGRFRNGAVREGTAESQTDYTDSARRRSHLRERPSVLPGVAKRNTESRAANKKAFDALVAAGDKNLFYLTGDKLIGDDGEGTVDGSHPTDLGFMRQADAFIESLTPILAKK